MVNFISKVIRKICDFLTSSLPVWLYIVVLLALVLFVGAISCTRQSEETVNRKMFVGQTEYQGHSYFVFRAMEGSEITVIHDPDCICGLIDNSE